MMDKNREAFEAWVNQQKVSHIIGEAVYEGDGVYKHLQHQALWNAWQASRQAIEIPVPDRKNASYFIDDSFGNKDLAAIWNSCRNEFLKGVTSLGIRVKGNEE